MQLQQYKDNNGIEIYIDLATHEAYCSLAGYSRMANVPYSTVKYRAKGGRFRSLKTAEIPTAGGLQGGQLISEDDIVEWLPHDSAIQATNMMKLGVRTFLHKLAGYEATPARQMSPAEILMLQAQALRQLELKQEVIENKLVEQSVAITQHEDRLSNVEAQTVGHQDYYSLKAFLNVFGLEFDFRRASSVGKALTQQSQILGYEVRKVPDAKYGQVNAYHIDVLKANFSRD